MSVQNEEELRNVWAVGWEACPSLLTGWEEGGAEERREGGGLEGSKNLLLLSFDLI